MTNVNFGFSKLPVSGQRNVAPAARSLPVGAQASEAQGEQQFSPSPMAPQNMEPGQLLPVMQNLATQMLQALRGLGSQAGGPQQQLSPNGLLTNNGQQTDSEGGTGFGWESLPGGTGFPGSNGLGGNNGTNGDTGTNGNTGVNGQEGPFNQGGQPNGPSGPLGQNGQVGGPPVNAAIVEVGEDGKPDDHANEVNEVYRRTSGGASALEVLDPKAAQRSQDGSKPPAPKNVQEALDQDIDQQSTDALNLVSQKIDQNNHAGGGPEGQIRQAGTGDQQQHRVMNFSMEYSRKAIYDNATTALLQNPELAKSFGLDQKQIEDLGKQADAHPDQTLNLPDNVAQAVVSYVDKRMDAPDSAFQKARANYQNVTQQAADQGIVLVVAAGNAGEKDNIYPVSHQGSDTNFLAQSDNVITVGASDATKTPGNNADDPMAAFSSHGDGRFNPTISTGGVQVHTQKGMVDGTSFSAPKVSGTVAQMLEANPNLSFAQVKDILQGTATDTKADVTQEGAGQMNSADAIAVAQQARQSGGSVEAQQSPGQGASQSNGQVQQAAVHQKAQTQKPQQLGVA